MNNDLDKIIKLIKAGEIRLVCQLWKNADKSLDELYHLIIDQELFPDENIFNFEMEYDIDTVKVYMDNNLKMIINSKDLNESAEIDGDDDSDYSIEDEKNYHKNDLMSNIFYIYMLSYLSYDKVKACKIENELVRDLIYNGLIDKSEWCTEINET